MRKISLLFILVIITACAHKVSVKGLTTAQKMRKADLLYNQKKYDKAKQIYEIVTFESKGDTIVKKAQFQLANSFYKLKLYQDAIYEYQDFLNLYPYSKYSEEAYYKLGMCYYKLSYPPYYEQQETKEAFIIFTEFINIYPDSPLVPKAEEMINKCRNKFLEKKYINAYIYYKMHYYNAALMYLQEILSEKNIKEELEKKSLILAGKVYIEKEDWDSLLKILNQLKLKYPEIPNINTIENYIKG